MIPQELIADPWFVYGVLPALIFIARILDVSLGTLRVIFISKGLRLIAPLIGFFEVLIWIIAISQIMHHLSNWFAYVAYAAGFAAGTWLGMMLESRLALGKVIVRVVTHRDASELVVALRDSRQGVTSVQAEGAQGAVKVLFMVVDRHDLKRVLDMVNQYNPNSFYSIEDVRYVREGVFPAHRPFRLRASRPMLRGVKKGK